MGATTDCKVHSFESGVYPFRLWVCVNPKANQISKDFLHVNPYTMQTAEITKSNFERDSGFTVATTYPMRYRKGHVFGAFTCIWIMEKLDVGEITHEAFHVTDLMCDYLGVGGFTFDSGEARAYFGDWVARCIDNVKTQYTNG